MEEVIVSPLLEAVIDKLGSGLWKELELHRGVKKDIEKLQSTLSTIKDELEDAEQRSLSDRPLSNWLKKLKDAAHFANDVMAEIQTEALRRRMVKWQVRDLFSSRNHIAFPHIIALKIKDLLERFDAIAEDRRNFHLTQGSVSVRIRHEETYTTVDRRDEYKAKVLKFLLNENNDEDLSVLAITGLGVLGKTTLAQLVYYDERIKSSFDLRCWVFVSDEFDVRVITRKIIQSVNKEVKCDHLELDPLGQLLRETLGGQRFILVLDDVWNADRRRWESLRSLLRCGNKGSKIVVTTRNEHVASVMNSVLSHRLKVLSGEDCWRLSSESAFGRIREEEESPVLTEIGRKIVKKCGVLPSTVKALGTLMRSKREAQEWLALLNDMNDSFDRKGGGGGGGGSAGGSGGSGVRRRGSGGRGEGGDSGSNGNQPGGYNNNGSLFFNLGEYNNWRLNARRVKILLLSHLLLEFLRKRSISPMENYLRGCGSETHQNTDLKIQVRGVPVNELKLSEQCLLAV